MSEYPKVICVGTINVTVTDADDEARWCAAAPSVTWPPAATAYEVAEHEPSADPLESVTVEMENPAYNEPEKPKKKKPTT